MKWLPALAATLALAAPAAPAAASLGLPASSDRHPTLRVSRQGIAVVTFRNLAGETHHLLAWGAVDGIANPTLGEPQRAFRLDYSGGWKSHGDARWWRTLANACAPYDGPPLPFLVAACKAPDGTYWALQSWQRLLPMRGFDPWLPRQSAYEVHLSHWSGELPVLEIYRHWTYANAQQGFFGRLLYRGRPVYGLRTPSAAVSDPWARNVYVDTFDSDFGPGWRHDTAIATHRGNGGFCYTFVPQPPPRGYPSSQPRGNGLGRLYRVTAMGPGVTPVVQWVGTKLTAFDAARQAEAARAFARMLGGDRHCAGEQ